MTDTTDRITSVTTERDAPAPARVRGNGRASTPGAVREEIEATRARLSRTLDQLEDRLVAERRALERKKEELWEAATLQ
ncbi:MAG: DUF3618 domain-containing protein, partial [Gemmatimonadota bacterium]